MSWTDHVENVKVLRRVGERRLLMRTIIKRKKNCIGHVLSGEGLLKEVMEGRLMGKEEGEGEE